MPWIPNTQFSTPSDCGEILGDARANGVIHTTGPWALGNTYAAAPASVAWPTANTAVFVPFRVPVPVTISHLVMSCGTGTGGSYDQGIYSESGNLIIATGSTARPGASQESIVGIADTVLTPGMYYLALALDGTHTVMTIPSFGANAMPIFGLRKMAAAFPLPSTATFASMDVLALPSMSAILKREPFLPSSGQVRWPPLNVINSLSVDSAGSSFSGTGLITSDLVSTGGALGANVVHYVPFVLHEAAVAYHMSCQVGATSDGNVDMGIYDGNGNLLVNTGSTAQATALTRQSIDITDTPLDPNQYYMAITLSSAIGTIRRTGPTDEAGLAAYPFYLETTGGFGLPATMTPTFSTAAAPLFPWMGVHFNSLV